MADLCARSLPDEALAASELDALLWGDSDPSLVLGTGDGTAALACVARPLGDDAIGYVRLVVVDEARRRTGTGQALLARAEEWLAEQGALVVLLGGEAPYYLWPGVDTRYMAMLCLAESGGYSVGDARLNLSCATDVAPVAPPDGVVLREVPASAAGEREPGGGAPADVAAVRELMDRCWPWWRAEVDRAMEVEALDLPGRGCLAAFAGDRAVGMSCHGVHRSGWFGPIGTDPAEQRSGVGRALLAASMRAMSDGGAAQAQIAWIGPFGFYARAVGATASATYLQFEKRL